MSRSLLTRPAWSLAPALLALVLAQSAGCDDRPASGQKQLTGQTCATSSCGAMTGVADQPCADGSTAGYTGRCLEYTDGSCDWEVTECPAGGGCSYDGESYAVGDDFPSSDGCNSCSCGAGGGVSCTERACAPPECESLDEATCTATRGCRADYVMSGCACPSTDPDCTCPPAPPPAFTGCSTVSCFYFGQSYGVDETFTSANGCDPCVCGQDGQATCEDTGCAPTEWFSTCGDPACGGHRDDPTVRLCTAAEMAGVACSSSGDICDPGDDCNTRLVCTTTDPTMGGQCPISQARHKRGIEYLDPKALQAVADQLMSIPLSTYRYKAGVADGGQASHLGFIIDDVGAAACVNGDGRTVNLYGYTSMAVAALQVQQKQIEALRAEVESLRKLVRKRR